MNTLNQFFFGIYPYIALTVFLLGSLVRFEREQYTWKTDSSQLLHHGRLRLGNILFHVGILGLFFGHAVGLLTPVVVWDTLGVSHSLKQMVAMVAGGVMGGLCLIGLLILIHRRMSDPRIAATTAGRQAAAALDPGHAAAGPVDHRAVRRSHGRRGDGQPDDLGAAHRHLPGRRRQPYRRRLAGVQGAPVHGTHAVRDLSLHPAGARLERLASLGYLGRAWQLVRPR